MQRFIVSLAASACFAALLGAAAPAQAQLFATFVSGNGDNGADCGTPNTACREISAAIAKTNAFGVVHVLPGAYNNGLTVDKTLDIVAEGGLATVQGAVALPGGGNSGILVDGEVVVRIRGLEVHTSTGGIALRGSGGVLYVEDCVLVTDVGSVDYGIDFRPSGASELYVSDTVVAASGSGALGGGIQIKPTGAGSAKVVLNNTLVENNATGILIDSRFTTGSNAVTIRNSTISGNNSFGLATYESGSGTSSVTIEGSNISNNIASFGVGMSGAGATARVVNSTVTGNARGLLAASSSSIVSHGGNVIAGNTINGAFTSTVPPQ
jgi:hypothetical protein